MSDLTLLSNYLRRDDFASGDLSQFNFGRVVQAGALALLGLACSTEKRQSEDQKIEFAQFQSELKDATPVQLGALTPNQRVHSKLSSLYSGGPGQTLTEFAASVKAKGHLIAGYSIHPHLVELGLNTPKKHFTPLVRDSDTIIRGTVARKTSQLTEDQNFIFTDYEILILEVMKGDGRDLVAGKTITVTRPGGRVLLDGVVVTAFTDAFSPLPVNGHEVVLFLRKISESGTYQATNYNSAIELEGVRANRLGGVELQPSVQTRDSLLAIVRALTSTY